MTAYRMSIELPVREIAAHNAPEAHKWAREFTLLRYGDRAAREADINIHNGDSPDGPFMLQPALDQYAFAVGRDQQAAELISEMIEECGHVKHAPTCWSCRARQWLRGGPKR
jgi:hypothetical protein